MDKAISDIFMGISHEMICHASLPNAGLGNKLFVWARAWIYAKKNNIPLVVSGWNQLQLAPILKGGDLRLYLNYFKNVRQVSWAKWQLSKIRFNEIVEPDINSPADRPYSIYKFNAVPSWSDYFRDLKLYREEIRNALLDMLTNSRKVEYKNCISPEICVQVRLGDFRNLRQGENFAHVGLVRTPMEYFTSLVENIRKIHGTNLPVTLVSDGNTEQLKDLLRISNVKMGPKNSKIVDILMMGKSKILVTSAGSTFGFWGGFLGDNALIIHRDHVHSSIRPDTVNNQYYEGPVSESVENWSKLLIDNIMSINI